LLSYRFLLESVLYYQRSHYTIISEIPKEEPVMHYSPEPRCAKPIVRLFAFLLSTLAVGLAVLSAGPARAQWIEGGIPIIAESGDQYPTTLVPDGNGGAFIVWPDSRLGTSYIYAQRIDRHGVELWTPGGILVCAALNGQYIPVCVNDGAGGIITAWSDLRSGASDYDVYAQRIDGDGNLLWLPGGVGIATISSNQYYQRIVSDGEGGAIICWQDEYSGNANVFAQRIDASGAFQWPPSGVPICVATNNQTNIRLVSDGVGGAIAAWRDYRNGVEADIYAQRVNHAGSTLWTYNGVAICTAHNTQNIGTAISDGENGAIIVWEDLREDIYFDIYAQRIDSLGTALWTPDGMAICTGTYSKADPTCTMTDLGNVFFAWDDQRSLSNYDIYAQLVTLSGSPLWLLDGVPATAASGSQHDPQAVSDLEGGIDVVWVDYRNGNQDIYAQRLDRNGAELWATGGVPVCTEENDQYQPIIATDGDGGLITIYRHDIEGDIDLYAQRVERYGYWGFPSPAITGVRDIAMDQGGRVTVTWDASSHDYYPIEDIIYYSVWRMLPEEILATLMAAGETPLILDASDPLPSADESRYIVFAGESYGWEWLGDVGAYYFPSYTFTAASTPYHSFIVISHTEDHFVFWKSDPDSGYSVDNLAPSPPEGVTAEQSVEPEGFEIAWEPNTEADLACYAIYRSTYPLFEPSAENLLSRPCETEYFDSDWLPTSGFWYKLAAVDIHGNESEYVIISPSGVTGDDTPVAPAASYLQQNYPNPFNPLTTIRFGLKERAEVSLRIYDPAGRLVRTLVDEPRDAARHAEDWDGRDNAGRSVASGVYFYRLKAGAFEETKKMVLLR
jgi:hypothetical protein